MPVLPEPVPVVSKGQDLTRVVWRVLLPEIGKARLQQRWILPGPGSTLAQAEFALMALVAPRGSLNQLPEREYCLTPDQQERWG